MNTRNHHIAEITESYRLHPGYKHWFWRWMAEGAYSLETLRCFARFYKEHVKRYRCYLFGVGLVVTNQEFQCALNTILSDELGQSGAPAHPVMFRSFMGSLGLDEVAWNQNHLLPGVQHFYDVHHKFVAERKVEQIVGALIFALEGATPYRHRHVVEGLRLFSKRESMEIDETPTRRCDEERRVWRSRGGFVHLVANRRAR